MEHNITNPFRWQDECETRDDIYYKLIWTKEGNDIAVCEMQWFDEYDYDASRWVMDEKFHTEEEAKDVRLSILSEVNANMTLQERWQLKQMMKRDEDGYN
jgi:hypothetical protein